MVEVEAGRVFPVAFAAVGAPVLPLLGDVRPYVLPVERSLLVLRSLDRRVQDFLRVELRGLHDGAAGAGPLGEPVQPVLLVRDDAFDGGRDPFGRARAVLEPERSAPLGSPVSAAVPLVFLQAPADVGAVLDLFLVDDLVFVIQQPFPRLR